eukprot:11169032-Lingulodinium_polyedra.AAC.1
MGARRVVATDARSPHLSPGPINTKLEHAPRTAPQVASAQIRIKPPGTFKGHPRQGLSIEMKHAKQTNSPVGLNTVQEPNTFQPSPSPGG